jgi:hypothetical protein
LRAPLIARWKRETSVSFSLPLGRFVDPDDVRGYPVDFRTKASAPRWPPKWIDPSDPEWVWVAAAQWGLGAFEHHVAGDGKDWLEAALGAGRYLLAAQQIGGDRDGAWLHENDFPHTFPLSPPWISAMAQGEAASLLVRLYRETGDDELAEAAGRALRPLAVPSAAGGTSALLDGRPFPEEYPTDPPSFVLNGGIFALWGVHDVAVALDDADARRRFEEGVDTLAGAIHRWDTAYWSLYDLFPHAALNIASPAYHELHITQLRAMHALAPRRELAQAADRFERYLANPVSRAHALARKVLFRLVVPRNQLLARRLPWVPKPPA